MRRNQFARFTFEGHTLRVRTDDFGAIWVVLNDLCNAAHTERDRAGRLMFFEKALLFVRTPGGNQQMLCVSEQGMNLLLSTSTSPQSKRFIEWSRDNLIKWCRYEGGAPDFVSAAPDNYKDGYSRRPAAVQFKPKSIVQ